MLISRRRVVKGIGYTQVCATGLGAAGLGTLQVLARQPAAEPHPPISQGAIKVSFTTSWISEGPNLFAYVARDKVVLEKSRPRRQRRARLRIRRSRSM